MNEKLIQSVSPVPVPAQLFVAGPLLAGFLSLIPAGFTFVISNIVAGLNDSSRIFDSGPVVTYGLAMFILCFVLLLAYFAAKCFIEPSMTIYRIFSDRIEYQEGLLNKQKRTLMLDQVIDVVETQGVLQQTAGAGTVSLVTQQLTSQGDGKLSNRTIRIQNIPNSNEVYETLRKLAAETTPNQQS